MVVPCLLRRPRGKSRSMEEVDDEIAQLEAMLAKKRKAKAQLEAAANNEKYPPIPLPLLPQRRFAPPPPE